MTRHSRNNTDLEHTLRTEESIVESSLEWPEPPLSRSSYGKDYYPTARGRRVK